MSSSRAPTTHDQFLALAATSIDFRLSPQEERRLHDHLARCPACARAATALSQDAAVLSRQPRADAPWAVQDAVLRAASTGQATGRSSGRPSIGPMLGLALLIVALAGSVFVAGSVLNSRVPPAPDATLPATVDRRTQPPRQEATPLPTSDTRTPSPAGGRADWTALGDLTDQFEGGSVNLMTRSPEGGYLAFGRDPTGTAPIVWSSTNGRAWRELSRPADTFGAGGPTAASPGGDGLVVTGRDVRVTGTQNAVWTTSDGRTWRRLPQISSQIATRQGTVRIAAGPMGLMAWLTNGRAWWSSDGADWRRTGSLGSDVTDVAVDDGRVIAVGRQGDRVWVADSGDGIVWPDASRSTMGTTDLVPSGVTPGAEQAAGLPPLVWAGRGRLEPGAPGPWAISASGRLPATLAPGQVAGGPRGYLAVAAIDPATGGHRAWTSDGDGAWSAVQGSNDGLVRPEGVFIVGIASDDEGWLILTREGARYTGWRVER